MYSYEWDRETHGYILNNQTGHFVANEIRPVFAPELMITGLDKRFIYDKSETRPLMWAQKNTYLVDGEKVAQLHNTQYGKPLDIKYFFEGKMRIEPVDIKTMVKINTPIMDIVAADAKRRAKELYDEDIKRCDIAYIAFSGGKDSVALLDICHRVLPFSVPVIFSDTDMEFPDTYNVWNEIQQRYPEREFIKAKAERSALENWRLFGPPARTIRWCCSVHKSTPALMMLKEKLHKSAVKVMAFVGVRGDESISRSFYEDSTDGVKNASQLNRMPILDWGAHELWLYIFANGLLINEAYKKGISRIGCIMCPESSSKYLWFAQKNYSQMVKTYSDIIIETSSKEFKTKDERNNFVGSMDWGARKSGVVLRDTIQPAYEKIIGLEATFQSPHFSKPLFYEWIKTIGTVTNDNKVGCQRLRLPNKIDEGIPFTYDTTHDVGGIVTFKFRDNDEKVLMLTYIRAFLRKISACICCGCCESECVYGAITIREGSIRIDGDKCMKCRKCYSIEKDCWRFKSMYKSENDNCNMTGINRYNHFGLREEWLPPLIEMRDKFFPWSDEHPLGSKMVQSASAWFQQALLVEVKTRKATILVDVFDKFGSSNIFPWQLIWIALANNAVLIKWFVSSTSIDQENSIDALAQMLTENYPTLGKTTIKDGLTSLKETLLRSPLGGEDGIATVQMKGRTAKSITRKTKKVNSLTILYGLYLIAQKIDRSSFTVRELISANTDSSFISPIVAFGISSEDFKKQCEGLRSRYPDYIETTFTHGNDEFTIFPQKHTIEDIIRLALED